MALRSCGVLKGRVWEHVGAAGVSLAPESGARRGVVSWPPPYGACESAACRTVARGGFDVDVFFAAIPTTACLVVFALMHVPINIPALAASTNVAADMNAELVSFTGDL